MNLGGLMMGGEFLTKNLGEVKVWKSGTQGEFLTLFMFTFFI